MDRGVKQLIEVVCHRGANEYAPENTYASAQYCIDWGVDYLEIDVNCSADGVMYVFHGPDLTRTTNGSGKIYEHSSDVIDQLDCGSWFHPDFHDQRIPRLSSFLDWIDHRVKLFFDVKWAPLPELISLIEDNELQNECFFWFGRDRDALAFRNLTHTLNLKINVSSGADIERAVSVYAANIVELSLADCNDELLTTAQRLDVKTMILQREKNDDAYRRIIHSGVDMINLDHGDHFLKLMQNETSR